ncbi:MAG: pro-sigmaK processing inhibitor BofA family protein [Clostridia bacterium]|nr:pro-sigmaK processing inhibitor BofA family protein [Clostridia bacterium]
MKTLSVLLISLLSVSAFVLIILYIRSRRPIRSAVLNALLGLAALAAVDLTARFTGVYIPINIYSLPGAAIFGMPAVCAFVIIQMII